VRPYLESFELAILNPKPRRLRAPKPFDLLVLGTRLGMILVKYGLDRILYGLSLSKHCDAFALKGAALQTVDRARPSTRLRSW